MEFLRSILQNVPEYRALKNKLISTDTATLGVSGLSDIHKSHLINALADKENTPVLIIVPNEKVAQIMCNDLNSMGTNALVYPAKDFNFHNVVGKSQEYEHTRLRVLSSLLTNEVFAVIATVDAALQYTVDEKTLKGNLITLHPAMTISPETVVATMVQCGYEHAEQVEGPGQFSHRGGIIDIFSPDKLMPVRIEFWGDEIDTIAEFDVVNQRRTKNVENFIISMAKEVIVNDLADVLKQIDSLILRLSESKNSAKAIEILQNEREKLSKTGNLTSIDKFISLIYKKTTLFDYFKEKSLLFIVEPSFVKDRLKATLWQWQEDLQHYLEDGTLLPGLDKFSQDKVYFIEKIQNVKSVYLDTFAHSNYEIQPDMQKNILAKQLPIWNGSFSSLCEDLRNIDLKNAKVVVLSGSEKNAKVLCDDLKKEGFTAQYNEKLDSVLKSTVHVVPGALSAGFEYPGENFFLFTYGHFETSKKAKKIKKNSKTLYNLEDLNVGDYVVHALHGIGIFKGIHKVEIQKIKKDYITIEYAKNDVLYVPVMQLDMVDKYIGPKENARVSLNRLGSSDWQKAKARVRLATKDIAKELIKLYSERMHSKGLAFSEDGELQRDFEAHFEYEETPDQLRCIDEIKQDMEKAVPMDRLLCGDVGFGKTEVALRAAFKCVVDSKQCAILVPTTILAWQHYQTVLKRFESFPVKIELLSRFRTAKQQIDILKRLKKGEVDIIIGTHRLVQKDVEFYNLGLAIIDEEQRFGVKQKERFKNLVKNVDVLTLSATPIPRTLNMAMSGIRDMSTIEEAPQNRHPVQTYVLEYNDVVINEAIRKELRRGGQVYYLHNDVGSISNLAAKIAYQIPEARVAFGHGKMSEQELSDVWQKVINHEVDVLVCTTIIETGVDIPNVNTLIIDNADRLGLSQLHQIRGRVGRSSRRAFAYFTFRKNKTLTEISQKRLSAIREFTEFGSGFKIAMRDLELRGAGNILSGEQHGHMADVGYDMYLKLLGEAIKIEKGEKVEADRTECLIDISVQAYIPENYIGSTNARLEIYRRISDIRTQEDSNDVIDELIDRFGDVPQAVLGLIDIAIIRNAAGSFFVEEIKQQGNKIILKGEKISQKLVMALMDKYKGKIRISAGAKPFIAIETDHTKTLIQNLKNILHMENEVQKT